MLNIIYIMKLVEVYLKTIGQRIAEQRIDRGDTQVEFGVRLGVSRHTVAKMEQGHPSTKFGLVLEAAIILGCLETFNECMEKPVDPFELYDQRQKQSKKRRARRKMKG